MAYMNTLLRGPTERVMTVARNGPMTRWHDYGGEGAGAASRFNDRKFGATNICGIVDL
jgi:hypothetical protein